MIVRTGKDQRGIKEEESTIIASGAIGAAPLCLIGGTTAVEAAHHVALGSALFGKKKN
jgi:hypothetical protein